MKTATALHLHCPGLLGPLPDEAVDLVEAGEAGDALALLLSRGRLTQRDGDPDQNRRRFKLIGLIPPAGGDLPVGPLSMLGDGLDPSQHWVYRADPVHLRPDRDRLLVLEPGRLALPEQHVSALIRDFNSLFAEDGLNLQAPHPDHWYLRVDGAPDLRTTPLDHAMARPMGECLPTGDDARAWMGHLNTMQMLLHESPLNRHREAEGRRTITGIWPWGGGRLPPAPDTTPWAQVYTDEPLVRGMARHLGVPLASIPEPNDLFDQPSMTTAGPVLVDVGAFPAVQDGDSFRDWESALNAFAIEWAVPLLEALRAGALQKVVLDLGARRWELTPQSLRHFWRRRKPLRSWLERDQS